MKVSEHPLELVKLDMPMLFIIYPTKVKKNYWFGYLIMIT